MSKLELTPEDDGVPSACVVNLDNFHTLRKDLLRRRLTTLSPPRRYRACQVLLAATSR